MKRFILIVALAVTLLAGWQVARTGRETAVAQTLQSRTPASSPSPAASPATPLVSSAQLECQGCHASGKTLPYLAGAQFHTKPHTDYEIGFHAVALRNGGKAATCIDCHTRNGDMSTILAANESNSTINRKNIAETCGRCHGDKAAMQGSGISDRLFLSYRESVHAKAIARGNIGAAVCTDCHNSHDILRASNPQSTIAKVNVPATCGKCHQAETAEFVESVHGKAVLRGVSRSPGCTDCHGIHTIEAPFEQKAANTSPAVATESCARCHEGVALTQEFGIAEDRVSSYKDSYHGLASKFGSKVVANCSSCHGVHNILPSSDPKSMISAANLTQTCGQCHVGAGDNFTRGRIHLSSSLTGDMEDTPEDMSALGTRIVRWIYLPIILLVIGGMVIHNALVWRKKAAEKLKHERRTIVRLTFNQRIQHWLLLTSFIVLVISGFALQYPDSWLGWIFGSSEYLRRVIHRVAAVVMLLSGAYHLAYLAFAKEGRKWVKDMLPRWKDFTDLLQNFGYYLGVSSLKPKMERFGYPEKAEYWAVVWGTIIMGLTGLMIWFKIAVFSFLERWWIDVALAVHFYEAILATLAIIVWHFYQVIFDPHVYPVNFAFLDGKVSEELYKEEHELDYERLKEAERAEAESATSEDESSPA